MGGDRGDESRIFAYFGQGRSAVSTWLFLASSRCWRGFMYAAGGMDKGGNGLTRRIPGMERSAPQSPQQSQKASPKLSLCLLEEKNLAVTEREAGGEEKRFGCTRNAKPGGEIGLSTRARPTWLAEVLPFLKTSGKNQEQKPYSTLGPS